MRVFGSNNITPGRWGKAERHWDSSLKKVEQEKGAKSLPIERAENTLPAVSRQAGNSVQEFVGAEANTREDGKQGIFRSTRELAGECDDYDETILSHTGVHKGNYEPDVGCAGVDRR